MDSEKEDSYKNYIGMRKIMQDYQDNLVSLISEQKELLESPWATEDDKRESRNVLKGLNEDLFSAIQKEIELIKKYNKPN